MDIIELTQTKQWDKGSREDEGVSFHSGCRKSDEESNMELIAGPAQMVTQWAEYNILFILACAPFLLWDFSRFVCSTLVVSS